MRGSFIILLLFLTEIIYSQDLCFHVDSVKIVCLPRQLKTKLSLDDYDIINFSPASLKKDTIILDDLEISELINILGKTNDYESLSYSIDTRMVIFIFVNKDFHLKISVDHLGNFKYLEHIYFRDKLMLDWIRRNVSTWKNIN
jgi:hypothetical protein